MQASNRGIDRELLAKEKTEKQVLWRDAGNCWFWSNSPAWQTIRSWKCLF